MSVPSSSSSSGKPKRHPQDQEVPKSSIEPSTSIKQAGPLTSTPRCNPADTSIAQAEPASARNSWMDPAVVVSEPSTVFVSVLPTMPYSHPRVAPPFRTVLSAYASTDQAAPSAYPSENCITRRRSRHARESQRPSRQSQNYGHNRDEMGTAVHRGSRILTARMKGTELYRPYFTSSQNPPSPQLTPESNAAAIGGLNIHEMLNLYLASNNPPSFPSRYPSHFLLRSLSQPSHSYDQPYISQGPMNVNQTVVPLDLSVPTGLGPEICPRWKTLPVELHTQDEKFYPVLRTTPRTHTVTSFTTNNTPSSPLMHTHLSDREELNQTRSHLQLYANRSDYLLNQPCNQRPQTPAYSPPEHLRYQLLHIDTTDQEEEVQTSVCDLGDTTPRPYSDGSAVDGRSLLSTSLIPPPSRMATVPQSALPSRSPRTTPPPKMPQLP